MRASERLFGRHAVIRFGRADWQDVIEQLQLRAGGRRESGAFLLARPADARRVSRVLYFDDLDPGSLDGGVHLRAGAFSALWDLCRQDALVVVGDVHTHPGDWVGQSEIDRGSPLVGREGHLALIVPRLASGRVLPRDIGLHRYDGGTAWTSWSGAEAAARVYAGRWP
ncbi:MAG: hypothetical protein U0838_02370 [Chloroflexota bacterium]